MKIFIVFLAFVILWTACLTFQTDFNAMLLLQRQAKNLAEDCAAGSAMMLDRRELASGNITFNQLSTKSYNSFMLRQQKYSADCEYSVNYAKIPSVHVKLIINRKNFFRNRNLSKEKVQVSSMYGWE